MYEDAGTQRIKQETQTSQQGQTNVSCGRKIRRIFIQKYRAHLLVPLLMPE